MSNNQTKKLVELEGIISSRCILSIPYEILFQVSSRTLTFSARATLGKITLKKVTPENAYNCKGEKSGNVYLPVNLLRAAGFIYSAPRKVPVILIINIPGQEITITQKV